MMDDLYAKKPHWYGIHQGLYAFVGVLLLQLLYYGFSARPSGRGTTFVGFFLLPVVVAVVVGVAQYLLRKQANEKSQQ